MTDNMITAIRKDVAVLRAVLQADVEPTPPVIHGMWRWFFDVELALPLPVMPLSETERGAIALDAVNEMDEVFAVLEAKWAAAKSTEERNALQSGPEGQAVNALWREFAGCYAEMLNEDIPEIPAEEAEEVYEQAVNAWADQAGIDPAEIMDKLRNDSMFRMQLRRQGLDPDRFRA